MRSKLFLLMTMLALACSGSDLVLPTDSGRATTLVLENGDGQTGAVGGPLDDPLVVKAMDEAGRPVAGVSIEWSVSAGSVDPSSTVTGADGRASTRRVLGDELGTQNATASSTGLTGSPVLFQHTAVAGDAARLVKVAGDGQTAAVGATLPATLVVRLLDEKDNPIVGHAMTWLVTDGGGTISPSNGTTDAGGRSSARWTLGSSAGRQTVTAVVTGVGVVKFTATATVTNGGGGGDRGGGKGGGKGGGGDDDSESIVPTRVSVWRGNGQTARAGTAVEAAPAVIVAGATGRGVAGIRVSFTVVEGSGRLSGADPTTDAAGVATVGSWVLGAAGGTNRLRAVVQGSGIAGNPIFFTATATVPPPREPDRLVFRVQPSRTGKGKRIEPAVQVAVVRGGVVQSTRQGEVRLELRGGNGRARLHGSTNRELSDGVAIFNNLRIDREGRGYRLRASASGLTPIESAAFDIIDD